MTQEIKSLNTKNELLENQLMMTNEDLIVKNEILEINTYNYTMQKSENESLKETIKILTENSENNREEIDNVNKKLKELNEIKGKLEVIFY